MKKRLSLLLMSVVLLASCIQNDIPYPIVVPHITALEAEGAKSVDIDLDNRTIVIDLEETTDISEVVLKNVRFDIKDTKTSIKLEGKHDLSEPLQVTLTTYQDYVWKISAVQQIERYFTFTGQVGSTEIDAVNHRAIAYAQKSVSLSKVEVTGLKLGPKDITRYSKTLAQLKDFTGGQDIKVTAFGKTAEWHLFIDHTDEVVTIKKVNPWTTEVYIDAAGVAGRENGFKYRKIGTLAWNDVPKSCITSEGGAFSAHLTDLKPSTEYECYAFSGNDETQTVEFTTDEDRQFPNHSFEVVSKVTGKDYYKWFDPTSTDPECRSIWWASGNGEGDDGYKGTATLGIVLTVPDSDAADGKLAVCAQSSQLVGILACGNLFTGQFTEIIGSSAGAVHYGRPWTTRPKSLKLMYKYKGGLVDCVQDYPVDDVVKVGDKDRFQIFVGVGDWDYRKYGGSPDSPVRVSTAREERSTLFTPASPGIIACGNFVSSTDVNEWTELEIPLEYRSLDRIPTHIIVICAVNYRGDYMTGCSTAKLWLDNFVLTY